MDPDPDLTIVLLGKAGVGKSASGNTILGQAAFKSELAFNPVTEEICEATGEVFGKLIRVVDTPGILDDEDTKKKIQSYCQELLQSSRRCLFLVVVSVGRFTREDRMALRAAEKAIRPPGLKTVQSYLLFTNGEKLKDKTLEQFITESKTGFLPKVVKTFAGAYHLFKNEDGDQEQVRELLLKTGHLRTQHPPASPAAPEESARLQERRIVLLGRPGGGKSSSGNTILGCRKFKSDCDFDSVSTETVSESAEVEGRQLTVVDTPGFTDEVLTPEQLYMEIMKTLAVASPGPHAFVIVVRLGRISEGDIRLFELLPKLFGDDASKYIMVLFTGGDELGSKSIDDKIRANKHVSKLVSMCGGRYCVFDNTQTGNRQQVRNLMNKIDEIASNNGGEHYTSDMFRMAERFINEERSQSDLSPESSPSGASPENNSPDPPDGIITQLQRAMERAWTRLKQYVRSQWERVCHTFTQFFDRIRSRDSADHSQAVSTGVAMTPQHLILMVTERVGFTSE